MIHADYITITFFSLTIATQVLVGETAGPDICCSFVQVTLFISLK